MKAILADPTLLDRIGSMARFLSNEEILQLCLPQQPAGLPFTGERLVPGSVEQQLWNEHVSRYRFACLFASKKRVLDVGAGAGYGTEMMARSADFAVGIDSSTDAVSYAAARFQRATYSLGSATAFPFPACCFGLVTAFEVIEHLEDWNALLEEANRTLKPDGVFLVSTPNKEYYAEARGASGPNPYHVHEFDFLDFQTSLKRVFPFVCMLAQNQQETITFSGDWTADDLSAYIPPTNNVSDAHFFFAVCSRQPVRIPFFADVSSTHNLLREREKHLWGVMGELADIKLQHATLSELHRNTLSDLHRVKLECQSYEDLKKEVAATQHECERLRREFESARKSNWIRLGSVLGLGPWSHRT